MHISAEFITSVADADGLPRDGLDELAFIGRSNVGKSTLLNALVRQKIARTSAEPGKTRLANFFRVQRGTHPPLYLVDLPGFGYARRGSGTEVRAATAEQFSRVTHAYFDRQTRQAGGQGKLPSVGVLLLVDSRHPGLEADLDAWAWLRATGWPCRAVGTKVDKLSRAERMRHGRELASLFDGPVPLVSAATGEGMDELWTLIVKLPKQTVE